VVLIKHSLALNPQPSTLNRPPMSLSVCKTRLATVTRDICNQWDQTKHYWQDSKSQEFESQYIELLQGSVEKAVTVIDELDKLISKIRHDCE
jgi:hypothetical protein